MNTEELLTKTVELLSRSIEDRKEQTDILLKMLAESENRIASTNVMIQSLTDVCKKNHDYLATITRVYTEQFEQMELSRKNCQDINKGLLEALIECQNQMREMK